MCGVGDGCQEGCVLGRVDAGVVGSGFFGSFVRVDSEYGMA